MRRKLIVPKKKAVQPTEIVSSSVATPSIEFHQRDIWIKIINPPKELSQSVFNALRDHKIEEAKEKVKQLSYYSEEDEELLDEAEMEVIRNDYKEHRKYIEKTEVVYGQALWIKNPTIPFHYDFRWIKSDLQLMHHLGMETRFIAIFNYLSDKVEISGEELFPDRYTRTGKAWPYAIVKVNKAFYEEMSRKLSGHEKSITRISIEKYLKAFCDFGILIRLQLGGGQTKKDSLYAIGYWVPYKDIYRVHYFLRKSNPGVDRLLKFRVV